LKSCSRPTWLSFVREHFPHLAGDYERRYAAADFVDGTYRNRMATIMRQLCRRHGLGERSSDALLTRDVYTEPAAARKAPAAVARPVSPQALLFAG
jgi:hypothetical protein